MKVLKRYKQWKVWFSKKCPTGNIGKREKQQATGYETQATKFRGETNGSRSVQWDETIVIATPEISSGLIVATSATCGYATESI
jgi:hypothetical protein